MRAERTARGRAGAVTAALAIVVSAAVGSVPSGPSAAVAPPIISEPAAPDVAVFVPGGAPQARLAAGPGSDLVADYGAYSLLRVGAERAAQLEAGGATRAPGLDRIELRDAVIDTATGTEPEVPARLRAAAPGADALWIVQFAGPALAEWLTGLRETGVRPVAFVPANAFVVHGGSKAIAALEAHAAVADHITYLAPFRPAYRLAPTLRDTAAARAASDRRIDVVVQVVRGEKDDVQAVLAGASRLAPAERIPALGLTTLRVRVAESRLAEIAALPSVLNVEPYQRPALADEAAAQLVAGNIVSTGGNVAPAGPGYREYLLFQGVSSNPATRPKVAVVDDGIDNGTTSPLHRDFRRNGNATGSSRITDAINCTPEVDARSIGGHGNLAAGIIGGYNSRTGPANEDADGYNYGLGVDPWARLVNVRTFDDDGLFIGSACGSAIVDVAHRQAQAGVKISNNSWGAAVAGDYDAFAQAFDALTRDSSSAMAGSQPILYVFSAGNSGPNSETLSSPATAKNVVAVGASSNVRDPATPLACGRAYTDDADDIAVFSSRGPTADGRIKPDLVAPGTRIVGPASQAAGYTGASVCGPYYPSGQTLYTWANGTSFAAPAVSGAASIAWEYYRRVVNPGVNPSPAMLKAMLLNNTRDLDGLGASVLRPEIFAAGWGGVDVGRLLDPGRWALDQTRKFTASGQSHVERFTVTNSTKPIRVTMAFNDAPGSIVGSSYVNDLDLVVVAGGRLYRGNVMSGATSTIGGVPDHRNSVEQVILPAGFTGDVAVQVVARNVAVDAVPGGGALEQDFALTAVNLTPSAVPQPVIPYVAGVTAAEAAAGVNGNGAVEPGEMANVHVTLGNLGVAVAPVGSLQVTVAGGAAADVVKGTAAPGTIPPGGTLTVTAPIVRIRTSATCGGNLSLRAVYSTSGKLASHTFPVATGAGGTLVTYNSLDVPKVVTSGGSSELPIFSSPGPVQRMRMTVSAIERTMLEWLFYLVAPDGTSVWLNAASGSVDAYTNVTFDRDSSNVFTLPYVGTFKPAEPFSKIVGGPAGTWRLRAERFDGDQVSIDAWRVTFRRCAAAPLGLAIADGPTVAEGTGPGTTTMQFRVLRTGPTTSAITFPASTQNGTASWPSDYTSFVNRSFTMPAGATSVTVPVSIVADARAEPDETVRVVLGAMPPGVQKARGSALGTIKDDD